MFYSLCTLGLVGRSSVLAVALACMLIIQIATYDTYKSFPLFAAYSANSKPEDLIGKGYTYDVSIQISIFPPAVKDAETYLSKLRTSTVVSKYDSTANLFTLSTTVVAEYDGEKETTTYESVVSHDPFSNAQINRQFWMSAITDSFDRATFRAEIHNIAVKPVGPILIEFQASKYTGISYETQANLDVIYPAYIPTKFSFKLEERDKIFTESGLVYQADATLSGLEKSTSVSLKYHASLVKTDLPPGISIATQTLNSQTVSISEGNNVYPITFLYGDDTTILSKVLKFKESYMELDYETKPYAKQAIFTVLFPNQLMKDADLALPSIQVEVDNSKHSMFSLTSSDPDSFINIRYLPTGQHKLTFSFTRASEATEVLSEKTTSGEEPSAIAKFRQPSDLMVKAPIKINVMMLGDTWPSTDEVQKQLLQSYKPVIYSQNRTIGVEFVYNYNFATDVSLSRELFSYIDSIAIDNSTKIPLSLTQWLGAKYKEFEVLVDEEDRYYLHCIKTEKECKNHLPYGADGTPICLYDTCGLYRLHYKWIDASLVEEWLHNKATKSEGYTIFFLHPPTTQMNYLHSYGITTEDADSDKMFRQEGMMGFGGKYRSYFIDLTAGPSFYPDVPIPTLATIFHKNIFDTTNEQDYAKLIANYINDAITLLFTPSYLYEPVHKSKYFLDIFIIDQTSGRSFAEIAQQYLTASRLESSMKNLIPYSEWKFKIEGKSFDWLPRELGRAVIKSMSFSKFEGIDTIRINSATLKVELDKWAKSNLTPEKAQELEREKEGAIYLPVIILVFDAFAYVDDGALGLAMPDVSDPKVPCCVIIATEKSMLTDFDAGLTSITVHEAGHLVGLLHPHDGYREDLKEGWFQNWFFDWSSTPMTYASPIGFGCGEPFQYESGQWRPKECGMSISTYNQFNYDNVDRGLTLHLLRQAITNINSAVEVLQQKGYSDEIPSSIETALSSIDQDIANIEEQFVKMNYFSRSTLSKGSDHNNALDLTIQVLKNSQILLQQADELPPYVEKQEEPEKPQLPISESPVGKEPSEQQEISVAMKLKKKSTLLAIKNGGDIEVYSVKIKASDGNIRFVKAKGWDRDKVDASTIIIHTDDRPLIRDRNMIVLLIVDNRGSGLEWIAFDAERNVLSSGALIPKS